MDNDQAPRVTASINGRRVTLDSVMPREPLPLPVRRVETTLPAGLRSNWIDGEEDDPNGPVGHFSLTAGAGVGSPWLILSITLRDGSTISEVVDMRTVVSTWIAAALAAGPTPETT